ncbi:MAG: hypothetical protein GC145_18695 [Caulobacter sp.]|nr:hypothetical protein [Caulobacter sp.]
MKRPSIRSAAVIGTLFLVGFLLGGAFSNGGLFGPSMAAWVQAIGTIAAVGWAIELVGVQERAAQRRAYERRKVFLFSVANLVVLADRVINVAAEDEHLLTREGIATLDLSDIEEAMQALHTVVLVDLSDVELLASFVALKTMLRNTFDLLGRCKAMARDSSRSYPPAELKIRLEAHQRMSSSVVTTFQEKLLQFGEEDIRGAFELLELIRALVSRDVT